MASQRCRLVDLLNARLQEAVSLGFKTAVIPRLFRKGESFPKGIQILEARSLRQALDHAFVTE